MQLLQALIVIPDANPGMENRFPQGRILILTPQMMQQRRFPTAIASDDGDAVTAFDPQGFEAKQYRRVDCRANLHWWQGQQAIGIQRLSLQPEPPLAARAQRGLLLFQPVNAFLHLLGLAGQIFVVVNLAPNGQPMGAFRHPVDLFLLGLTAMGIRRILFLQRLARSSAG
ncbi:hypothetical protein D3C80_1270410 [compost metagenome]